MSAAPSAQLRTTLRSMLIAMIASLSVGFVVLSAPLQANATPEVLEGTQGPGLLHWTKLRYNTNASGNLMGGDWHSFSRPNTAWTNNFAVRFRNTAATYISNELVFSSATTAYRAYRYVPTGGTVFPAGGFRVTSTTYAGGCPNNQCGQATWKMDFRYSVAYNGG